MHPLKKSSDLYDPGYLLHVGDSTCHESISIIRCHKEFVALKTVFHSRNSTINLLPLIKKTSKKEGFWSNTVIDKWLFDGVNRDILPPKTNKVKFAPLFARKKEPGKHLPLPPPWLPPPEN